MVKENRTEFTPQIARVPAHTDPAILAAKGRLEADDLLVQPFLDAQNIELKLVELLFDCWQPLGPRVGRIAGVVVADVVGNGAYLCL